MISESSGLSVVICRTDLTGVVPPVFGILVPGGSVEVEVRGHFYIIVTRMPVCATAN